MYFKGGGGYSQFFRKNMLFVHTPCRQSAPTQEHLDLFVDCFGVHLFNYWLKILILIHLQFLTIFNFLKIHQFPLPLPPFFDFTFTLKVAKKFSRIYGSSHYGPSDAFLDEWNLTEIIKKRAKTLGKQGICLESQPWSPYCTISPSIRLCFVCESETISGWRNRVTRKTAGNISYKTLAEKNDEELCCR